MTPTEFIKAVAEAKRGDRIRYHVGKYAYGETCIEAYKAYTKDKVLLVQKRNPPVRPSQSATFDYLAVKV